MRSNHKLNIRILLCNCQLSSIQHLATTNAIQKRSIITLIILQLDIQYPEHLIDLETVHSISISRSRSFHKFLYFLAQFLIDSILERDHLIELFRIFYCLLFLSHCFSDIIITHFTSYFAIRFTFLSNLDL